MSVSQPQNNDEEIRKKEAEAAVRQKALMLLLDTNARQRLMNIRIVKPELVGCRKLFDISCLRWQIK